MKNFKSIAYMLSICCIIYFPKVNAQATSATLFITSDGSNPQLLVAVPDKYGISTVTDTVKLNSAEKLKYIVKIKAPQSVYLRYGKSTVQLWAVPGNSLNIDLKAKPEFSGDAAVFANYYADDRDFWRKIAAEYNKRNPDFERESKLFSGKYFLVQDSITNDRVNFLKIYFSKINHAEKQRFIEQQANGFHYMDLYYKMTFEGSDFEKFKFIQNRYKINRPDHYQYSDVAEFNDPKLLSLNYYRSFYCTLIRDMALKKIKVTGEKFSDNKYLDLCMNIIDELTTNTKVRDDFKAVFLNDVLVDVKYSKDAKRAAVVNDLIKVLLRNNNTNLKIVKANIDKIIADVRFAKGAQAPDFILKDTAGKVYTLDNFKGKKLYFDMSASWCGPCIAAIPAWNKLGALYGNNENVVFITVSLDDNESEWRAFIKKYPMRGLQLYAGKGGFKNEFAGDYDIKAIPHYLLIDESGKIAAYTAPNPDSDEILTFLK
ncbi:TlpA family protein disulfide reductase [Mucilaginibacter sp. HD30]